MASNLPPGCSPSDIPGNRPEDAVWEEFLEWANNRLVEAGLTAKEAKEAIEAGIRVVMVQRERETDNRAVYTLGHREGYRQGYRDGINTKGRSD